MEAKEFKQQNVIIAKNQPQYNSLPALVTQETSTFRFKLSEKEIQQVIETGTIYLTICNFSRPLQPIGPSLLNPFINNH
jgi:hypothetical protein